MYKKCTNLITIFLFFAQLPAAARERPNGRVYGGQILPRQVQDEAALSAPALPAGRPGAQTHLPAAGGVQHRGRPALHQEADRHANIDHDQSDCPFGTRSVSGSGVGFAPSVTCVPVKRFSLAHSFVFLCITGSEKSTIWCGEPISTTTRTCRSSV